jgi:Lrp/AsnC family leucine-responsive transcriptional regulator
MSQTTTSEEKPLFTNHRDLLMLSHLRSDGRMRLTDMSRKTGIPISTLFDRLRMNKLITRHTCLIDFRKLGYHTRATITLKVKQADRQVLKEHLMRHPNVNTLHKIGNGFDFMVEAVFRQVADVEAFCDALEERFGIEEKNVYFVVEDIRREAFLSDPMLL